MHRKAVLVALSTLMLAISGGIFPTVKAQSNDPAPTDKRAYLPGSQVASGSGRSNGVFVALKYTEIATTNRKARSVVKEDKTLQ